MKGTTDLSRGHLSALFVIDDATIKKMRVKNQNIIVECSRNS